MSLKFFFLLSVIIFWFGCQSDHESYSEYTKPNILVLIADDAGWRDFGCYGNQAIRTPHVDALAEGGFKAENAFLTIPQCSPSRISILTGKYPHQTGAEDLHMPLPESEILIPTYLKKADYFTGYLCKAHLGPAGEKQFDWSSSELDDFSKFLEASKDHPFFMWVGFWDPHRPYTKGIISNPHDPDKVIVPPYLVDDSATRADLADYYNEINRMDTQIGSYVDILKNRNLLENTLIIFFSDNGAPFPRAKGTLYDSGIKTPLIFHWPAIIKKPVSYSHLMSVIDLAPTILDACRLELPEIMEGKSILNILSDPTLPGRKYIYSERNWHNCDEHIRSIRSEKFKFITNAYIDLPHGTPADLTASPSWKSLKILHDLGKLTPIQEMLFTVPRPAEELYDLQNDPYESKNLIADPAFQDIARELRNKLELWEKETNDFSPDERRRQDNTDRFTGVKFDQTRLPPRIDDN
jgi:arylsulfatase A-like enzyme